MKPNQARGETAPRGDARSLGLEGARSLWCCYCAHNVGLYCRLRGFALTPRSPACLEFHDRFSPIAPKSL